MSNKVIQGANCEESNGEAQATKTVRHYSTLSKVGKGMNAHEVVGSPRRKKGIADDEEQQHHPMYHTKRDF